MYSEKSLEYIFLYIDEHPSNWYISFFCFKPEIRWKFRRNLTKCDYTKILEKREKRQRENMEEDYNNPQVIELRNHVREVVTRTVAEQRISFIQNITSFSENPNKIQTKVIFFCVIIISRIDKWLKILLVNIISPKYLKIADPTFMFSLEKVGKIIIWSFFAPFPFSLLSWNSSFILVLREISPELTFDFTFRRKVKLGRLRKV